MSHGPCILYYDNCFLKESSTLVRRVVFVVIVLSGELLFLLFPLYDLWQINGIDGLIWSICVGPETDLVRASNG